MGAMVVTMALLAQAAGAEASGPGPEPLANPGSWITAQDYPPSAIRAGAEGRVVADLTVDAGGKVTACRVTASSGNTALDAATCAVMTGRGAFKPARDTQGRAVASKYTVPVRWALPVGGGGPPTIDLAKPGATLDTDIAVELSLDGEGKVVSCRALSAVVPSPGPNSETIDPCAPFQPGRQGGPVLRRDGAPVPSTIIQRLSRQTRPAK